MTERERAAIRERVEFYRGLGARLRRKERVMAPSEVAPRDDLDAPPQFAVRVVIRAFFTGIRAERPVFERGKIRRGRTFHASQ